MLTDFANFKILRFLKFSKYLKKTQKQRTRIPLRIKKEKIDKRFLREESYGPLRTQIRTKDFAPLFLRRPTSLQQFLCLGSNKTGLLRRNYLRPLLSIMRTSTSAPPFLNHLIRHKPPSPLYFLSQKQKKKKKSIHSKPSFV